MRLDNILIIILVVLALGGLVWSVFDFVSGKEQMAMIENTKQNYDRALQSELEDKCAVPDDYTEEEWLQHMSHHPDRYKECLNS